MNKKKIKILTILAICIILLVGIVIFVLNFTADDNSYSIIEKKWISDNKNNVIDVSVYNDVPVYGYYGEGVIFDFLSSFSEDNDVNFNKISYHVDGDVTYSSLSFRVLNNNEEVSDEDILMYRDNYVILSMNNDDLDDLSSIEKIGINKEDKEDVTYYLGSDIEYVEYDDDSELIEGLINEEVDYVICANMMHMDSILEEDINIVYNMTDISKKYVLRVEDDTLYSIMSKYYNNYLESDFNSSYSNNYLDVFFDSNGNSDLDRKNYNSKIYRYGYTVNMPYENNDGSGFVGVISNYLYDFENIFNIEIETVRYDRIDDIKNALITNDIDFALTNFNYDTINMDSVISDDINNIRYVVISKDNIDANDIKSFREYTLGVVGSSYLYDYCISNGIEVDTFDNTDDLLRNINDSSVVIMDYDTYMYYKDSRLVDERIVYSGELDYGYRFIVNEDSVVLRDLINYYVDSTSYNSVRYDYNTDISLDGDYTLALIVGFIGIVLLVLGVSLFIINKFGRDKTMSKEDRLKYIDPMTSLKNRNYLNHNIGKWDENVIFPQCIIMLDLNNLKEINDKEGREIGDEVVKRAASILINNQKENSDILRSSGDEFLIYLVGYDEDSVREYIKMLNKEFKNIPHGLGASIGYSMIYDEVKIIDDAINEALIMMMKNKEKK